MQRQRSDGNAGAAADLCTAACDVRTPDSHACDGHACDGHARDGHACDGHACDSRARDGNGHAGANSDARPRANVPSS